MAVKFQYNKTSLQGLEKQYKMRVRALPTIKNKESALRIEVKKAKDEVVRLEAVLQQTMADYDSMVALWSEFDTSLVKIEDVRMTMKKIAGVKIPVLEGVDFSIGKFSIFNQPKWFLDGIKVVKELAVKYGVTPSQIALNWLINFNGETVVAIPGASKIKHAEENIGAMTFRLTEEDMAKLDNVSK